MSSPVLSIITINFNNVQGLKKTISSVISQTWKHYEFIIIDGGSTDGSKEVISSFSKNLNYCVSEKDAGIYDAMNKGILQAKGEYLLFLNSGDTLESTHSLTTILPLIDTQKDIIACYCQLENDNKVVKVPQQIQFSSFWYKSICHQAVFIKRELFQKIGLYNASLKITADWEFFVKAFFLHNASYQAVPKTLSVIESGGLSSSQSGYEQAQIERKQVYENLFSGFMNDYIQLGEYTNSRIHRIIKGIKKIIRKFI